ncbi:SDR family oxidoreductase [Streptomyces sp. NPDC002573]|uniref:SDR family oxidoreductase n=1 Tax=Streptomyces sp. NPDC002573 TaxID=3364651 RepID=UPI00369E1B07
MAIECSYGAAATRRTTLTGEAKAGQHMPLCCHLVVPGMRARGGGSIIRIGATGTETGGAPGLAERAVVKSAQHTLGRALARKLGPDGIRVNTVAAGLVPTDANVGEHQASWIRRVGVRDTAGTGLPARGHRRDGRRSGRRRRPPDHRGTTLLPAA